MTIRVEHIGKSFGDFVALGDISLEFPKGELTALLGPSGCGKTTLLRIIAGLETADRGRILLNGQDASQKHVRERQVGFVFQHYALFRHMSVFENVAFGLRVKPRGVRPSASVIRSKVLELLKLVQLEWLADRSPAQLSGGQRQRVALARALAVEPQVLLLDEPFGALDAQVRKELRRWMRQLHDELHITSLFVTHDQEEALELADRVVLMNKGAVEQVGTPAEVYNKPASAFVFGFLGAANLLKGHVAGEKFHTQGRAFDLSDNPAAREGESVAYVRPHEFKVLRPPADGLPAIVRRIMEIGPTTRVELSGVDGQAIYEVEFSRREIAELNLKIGENVALSPRLLRAF